MAQDSDDLSIPTLTAASGRRRQPIQARGAKRVPSFDRGPGPQPVGPGAEYAPADGPAGGSGGDVGADDYGARDPAAPPGPAAGMPPAPAAAPTGFAPQAPRRTPGPPPPRPLDNSAGDPTGPAFRRSDAVGGPAEAPPPPPFAPAASPYTKAAGRPVPGLAPARPAEPRPAASRPAAPPHAASEVPEGGAPTDGSARFAFDGLDPVEGTDRRGAAALSRHPARAGGAAQQSDGADDAPMPTFRPSAASPPEPSPMASPGPSPGTYPGPSPGTYPGPSPGISPGPSPGTYPGPAPMAPTAEAAPPPRDAPVMRPTAPTRRQRLMQGDADDPPPVEEEAYDPLKEMPAGRTTRRPKRRRGRMVALVTVAAGLLVAAGASIWAWQMTGGPAGDVPLIRADTAPIRVEPENPGGLDVPHQDRLILNDPVGATDPAAVEAIRPPPETPVDPTTLLNRQTAENAPDPADAAGSGMTPGMTVEPPATARTTRPAVPTGALGTAARPDQASGDRPAADPTQAASLADAANPPPVVAPSAGAADGVEALLARRPSAAEAPTASGPTAAESSTAATADGGAPGDPLPLTPGATDDPMLPDLVTAAPRLAPAGGATPATRPQPLSLAALVDPQAAAASAAGGGAAALDPADTDGPIPGRALAVDLPDGPVGDMRIMLAAPLDLQAADPPFGLTVRFAEPTRPAAAAAPPAASGTADAIPSTGLGPPDTEPVPAGGRVLAQPDGPPADPIPALGAETAAVPPPAASPSATPQSAAPPSATPSSADATAPAAPASGAGDGFRAAGGGARVQLAAVPSTAAAQAEWARFVQTYPDLLSDLDLITPTVEVNGTTLWRVQGGPLTGDGARQICQAVVARGGDCIVRN